MNQRTGIVTLTMEWPRLSGRQAVPYQTPPYTPAYVAICMLILTWITILLRLWTRGYMIRSLGWDDLTIVLSLILYTVFATAAIMTINIVANPSYTHLKQSSVSESVMLFLIAELFYICTVLVFKISLGLFFLRITNKRWHRVTTFVAMGISTIFGLVYFFIALFQCGPPGDIWKFVLKKISHQCLPRMPVLGLAYTHALIVSMTDFCFALMPLTLLRETTLNIREKAILALILVMGTADVVCSLVRLKYIDSLVISQLDFFATAMDFTLWSLLEPAIGIIANSLATLRPLLRFISQRAQSVHSTDRRSTPTSYSASSYHVRSLTRHGGMETIQLTAVHDGKSPMQKRNVDLRTTTLCYRGCESTEDVESLFSTTIAESRATTPIVTGVLRQTDISIRHEPAQRKSSDTHQPLPAKRP